MAQKVIILFMFKKYPGFKMMDKQLHIGLIILLLRKVMSEKQFTNVVFIVKMKQVEEREPAYTYSDLEQSKVELEQSAVEQSNLELEQSEVESELEYTNISVMRQYMMKGSVQFSTQFSDINPNRSIKYNYSAESEPETSWTIPQVLHFIWLGEVIPEKYINNILGFVTNNPHFQVRNHTFMSTISVISFQPQVNLWTDENSISSQSVQQIGWKCDNFAAKDINRYNYPNYFTNVSNFCSGPWSIRLMRK